MFACKYADSRCPGEQGFTLIELMLAMAIFAIGMLAMAAMQGQGMRFNHAAYQRSQAAQLAYDMADRMRANLAGVNADNYAGLVAAQGNPSCVMAGLGAVCTPAAMALADATEWWNAMQQALPNGTGTVACIDSNPGDADPCTNGSQHTITVSWGLRIGGGAVQTKSFVLTVVP